MRYLALISALFALVHCFPGPPPTYQYSPPEKSNVSSYAAPLGSVGPLPSLKSGNKTGNLVPSRNITSTSAPSLSTNSTTKPTQKASNKTKASVQSPSPDQLFNDSISKYGSVIHKHVYVNLPPPEIEVDHRRRVQVKLPPPQRNYKILFIKAPSAQIPAISHVPILRRDEEKTLVYVLTKNPEGPLILPTAAPTQPSRPEVYFINYGLQKEESSGKGADKRKNVSGFYGPPKSPESSETGDSGRSNGKTLAKNGSSKSISGPY